MPVDVVHVQPEAVADFVRRTERESLRALYEFSVIWHEERHDLAAMEADEIVGAVELRIAASLAHVERIVVSADRRRQGIGRELLTAASETANYYNCHKLSAIVPHESGAQKFLERCGYRQEAVLPQHTFKLDMAVLRKFLL